MAILITPWVITKFVEYCRDLYECVCPQGRFLISMSACILMSLMFGHICRYEATGTLALVLYSTLVCPVAFLCGCVFCRFYHFEIIESPIIGFIYVAILVELLTLHAFPILFSYSRVVLCYAMVDGLAEAFAEFMEVRPELLRTK